MKLGKYILLISTLATLAPLPLLAEGRETTNGGHILGLKFEMRALEAVAQIRQRPDLYPELQGIDLVEVVNQTRFLVQDAPVMLPTPDGGTQSSTAGCSQNPATVTIHDKGWENEYNNVRESQGMALHEILCVKGIEKTGDYRISARYRQQGLHPQRLQRPSESWDMHPATDAEKAKFAAVLPRSVPNFHNAPKELESVSREIFLPIRDEKDGHQLKEMSIHVLEYEIRENEELEEVYQIVMMDARGKIFRSDIFMDSLNFRILPVAQYVGAEDLVIRSLTQDDRGNQAEKIRSVNYERTNYNAGYWGLPAASVTDIILGEGSVPTIVLGQPTGQPYGLYRARPQSQPELIKVLRGTIPGFEGSYMHRNSPGAYPKPMAREILALYKNDRGVFAVVNTLDGIMSINVETGESSDLYELPEDGRFAVVLKNTLPNAGSTCSELTIGIYRNDQGGLFYSGIGWMDSATDISYPGSRSDRPLYQLTIGISPTASFFNVNPSGCRP